MFDWMKSVIPGRLDLRCIDKGPFKVSLRPAQDAEIMFHDKYAIELILPINQQPMG